MALIARLLCLLLAGFLLGPSCASPQERSEPLGQVASEIDFGAGQVQGTLSWNGSPLASNDYVYLNAGSFSTSSDGAGNYVAKEVPPGSYSLGVFDGVCYTRLAQTSLTVAAGATTTANFDLSAVAGRVIGAITVNGSAPSYASVSIHCGGIGAPSGLFSALLAPGSYSADVYGPSGQLGSFSFDVTAGATTQLGTIDFSAGTAKGTISWNGAALSATDYVYVNAGSWSVSTDGSGNYVAEQVAPGTYDLTIHDGVCYSALGHAPVTVAAGAIATTDFDVTSSAGRVVGSIMVDGAPVPYASVSVQCGSIGAPGGSFSALLAPGTYSADIYGASGRLGSTSFSVTAGATTDLGSISFSSGDVEGGITWNGVPLASTDYVYVSSGAWSTSSDGTGHYEASQVPAGSYDLTLYSGVCYDALATAPVDVTAGATSTANFDLSNVAGRVVGSITVNGAPTPYATISVQCGGIGAPGGLFSALLAPRSYDADVYGASGLLGSFSFAVLAGQTTDIDNFTTPAGTNVYVSLSGGIDAVGGISLSFSKVSSGGNTTVVESGAGPPPPTGFRIVGLNGGPRYWDIDTTAGYSGPITVCIHYDPNDTHQETSLKLVHDDGSGFKDVTTSLDIQANIICGTATSLSPFAVVEPLSADADADGVADTNDACPSTPHASTVDERGCSLDDLVPCAGAPAKPWKNHGAYVKAFGEAAQSFLKRGLLSPAQKDAAIASAASSRCGK